MRTLLKINSLSKRIGNFPILNEVSFDLHEGEVLGVIGPSGAGKSSLLKCLAMLETHEGSILYFKGLDSHLGSSVQLDKINNDNLFYRNKVGIVFQEFNLWNWMSVLDNLILAPILVKGIKKEEAISKAQKLCQELGLSEKLDVKAWKLSGGEKQRVAILRTLMMEPEIILLDEITSGLDPILTASVMEIIHRLQAMGKTMILVTHHIEFATSICNRIMFLSKGRIVQIDQPNYLLTHPNSGEVENFLNILKITR